jgi:AcrR family transcriptional regulator
MAVTPKNKRGRPKDEGLQVRREEEILDAATRLFAERGFADADVQEIANELQIGKGTVYRYFPSKSELFLAAVDRGMRSLHAHVEVETSRIEDPLDRVVQAIHSYLAFFEEHPELVELFIQERAHFRDRAKPAYFIYHEANIGPWRELHRHLVRQGRVRDALTEIDIHPANDFLYGTILANHITGRKTSYRQQAENIVDILFRGILTDQERKRRYPKP